jgi:hypothetical protein
MRESSKNKRPDAELSTSREFRPLNLGQIYVGLGSHFEHRASHSNISPRTRTAPPLAEMTVAQRGANISNTLKPMNPYLAPMARFKVYLTALLLCTSTLSQGQSFGLQSLFNPGLRLGTTHTFDTPIDDSTSFGMTKYRLGLVIPLNGNVTFNLKELKAGVQANFWTINGGMRDVRLDGLLQNRYVYNFTTGVTGLKAGTGKGIWGYTANIGVVQDLKYSTSNNLFFIAGIIRLKVHGIHKQNYFGLVATYSHKRFLPVPIFGFRRKLFDKSHINVMLPVQIDIDYKAGKNVKFRLKSALGGFSNWTKVDTSASVFSEIENEQALFSYLKLSNGLEVRIKASKQVTIIVEGGVNAPARIGFNSASEKKVYVPDYGIFPFARLEVRFSFGSSLIGSHLFGNDF